MAGLYERALLRLTSSLGVMQLLMRVGTWIDRRLLAWTRGRLSSTLGTAFSGHVALLTTTGARSGRPRVVPVAVTPVGDDVVLVAFRGGHAHNPAWYHNLVKHPEVTLEHRGVAKRYTAREARGDERERLWRLAMQTYPGYATGRLPKREVPVIVLRPRAPADARGAGDVAPHA
jgi:deazaflavin-dependent oxidoreductase (nitroreductase family)